MGLRLVPVSIRGSLNIPMWPLYYLKDLSNRAPKTEGYKLKRRLECLAADLRV